MHTRSARKPGFTEIYLPPAANPNFNFESSYLRACMLHVLERFPSFCVMFFSIVLYLSLMEMGQGTTSTKVHHDSIYSLLDVLSNK